MVLRLLKDPTLTFINPVLALVVTVVGRDSPFANQISIEKLLSFSIEREQTLDRGSASEKENGGVGEEMRVSVKALKARLMQQGAFVSSTAVSN